MSLPHVCICEKCRREMGGVIPLTDAVLEVDRLRQELAQLRAKLHHIRNQSLEWAMTCEHDCPACDAMYEVIKGPSGQPEPKP